MLQSYKKNNSQNFRKQNTEMNWFQLEKKQLIKMNREIRSNGKEKKMERFYSTFQDGWSKGDNNKVKKERLGNEKQE